MISSFISRIIDAMSNPVSEEEQFLLDSTSAEDLENRQRMISRNEAPYQIRYNTFRNTYPFHI
jgi:hypothetical protein